MAGLFRGVLREIDGAMENTSEGYLAANRNFAQATRNFKSVQSGRDAAMRGRTEEPTPAFRALTPEGQQAFRACYVDPLNRAQAAKWTRAREQGSLGDVYPFQVKVFLVACA